MKKFTKLFILLILVGMSGTFALEVTGNAPTTGNGAVDSVIGTAFSAALLELKDQVKDIDAKPEKLMRGFADASVFASQGATQRGYGEPKLFTFTAGAMVGAKIGANLNGIADSIENSADDLKKDGDISLGLNIQAISGQFNLNTSTFLLAGLDLGVRGGYFKLNDTDIQDMGTIGLETFSVGIVANYQLIKEKTIVPVVLKWRGLSLGTGVIYQNTKLNYGMKLDSITQDIGIGGASGTIKIDPKLAFDMTIKTFTVPLEATTAVQLLSFLNITLGAGADFAFGKNDIKLGIDSDINMKNLPGGVTQTKAGKLKVSGGGDMAPTLFNFKVMTGIGFKFGPVIIDVPVTLYPIGGTGASVGVTLGFTL
jgi:hypothetical protein